MTRPSQRRPPPDPAAQAAAHARKLLQEELKRLYDLHEPPMPPATPAVALPVERRHKENAAAAPKLRRRKADHERKEFVV